MFKSALGLGIGIGVGAALVVPIVLPELREQLRPLARSAAKSAVLFAERSREALAELGEVLDDAVAEAQVELREAKEAGDGDVPVRGTTGKAASGKD